MKILTMFTGTLLCCVSLNAYANNAVRAQVAESKQFMQLAFNPQPEPPKTMKKKSSYSRPGSTKSFNPQPEPPKVKTQKSGYVKPGSIKAFNPQPEPPKVKTMQKR